MSDQKDNNQKPAIQQKSIAEDFSQFTLPSSPQQTEQTTQTSNKIPSVNESFWNNKRGLIWLFIFTLILASSIIAGFLILNQGYEKMLQTQISPTPTSPQISPSPAPKAIDLSKYKIEVLNGSGIPGEAARVKNIVEKEGFVVSSIGNADTSNYTQTIIKIKNNIPEEYIKKLKDLLSKSHEVSDTNEKNQTTDADVIIILGSIKME